MTAYNLLKKYFLVFRKKILYLKIESAIFFYWKYYLRGKHVKFRRYNLPPSFSILDYLFDGNCINTYHEISLKCRIFFKESS